MCTKTKKDQKQISEKRDYGKKKMETKDLESN